MSEVEGESEGEGEGEGEVVAAVAAVRSQRLSGTWHVTAREWGMLVGQLVGHHATAGLSEGICCACRWCCYCYH